MQVLLFQQQIYGVLSNAAVVTMVRPAGHCAIVCIHSSPFSSHPFQVTAISSCTTIGQSETNTDCKPLTTHPLPATQTLPFS